MYTLETKNIDNKPYLYAIRRVKIGKKIRKISVYVGKSAPKTTAQKNKILHTLRERELSIVAEITSALSLPDQYISQTEYRGVEQARIIHQYAFEALTEKARERWWRDFATQFIFESNKIEGSRLSESEVSSIVKKKKIQKDSARPEVREVENALIALDTIQSKVFLLNERSILKLHSLITGGLGIEEGFKKRNIVVNNKPTTPPGLVRKDLSKLITWWKTEKNISPFYKAIIFHQRFERIHPFEDGNGRTGRFILLWMLIKSGYGVILFRDANRRAYFSALSKADDGQDRVWLRHAIKVYRKTIHELWSA